MLVADQWFAKPPVVGTVLLLHGGGQTRHSWSRTGEALAAAGWNAVLYDQRGHGKSDWDPGGDYSMEAYARDLVAAGEQLGGEGAGPLVVVGASLGGIAGMIASGQLSPELFDALVLVDVTPEMKADGVEKILSFMAANVAEGFESLEQAADVIARYLPHRPRPKDNSGLSKNLRLDEDGRYRWHWDPRFLDSRSETREHVDELRLALAEAAGQLTVPVLLVRGRESELVGEGEAARFKALVPHAEIADVSGARHMVAGDRNDVFATAVLDFLKSFADSHASS
jgi:pimeloyl-ACP methyl ester carboxylesterase